MQQHAALQQARCDLLFMYSWIMSGRKQWKENNHRNHSGGGRGAGSSPYFILKLKDFQPNLKYIRRTKSTGAPALQNLDSCRGLSVWEENDQQNDGKTSSLSANRITSDSRWGTLLHSIQFSWFQCQALHQWDNNLSSTQRQKNKFHWALAVGSIDCRKRLLWPDL